MLAWALGSFAGATALLLALLARAGPGAPPEAGFAVTPVAQEQDGGWFQVTLDASGRQDWRGFSFELGRAVPEGAAADLSVRRHQLRAPGGARRATGGAWAADAVRAGTRLNPVLSDWYAYSYWTHRLVPRGDTFLVRLASDGGSATVQLLGYDCAGGEPGCLTLRYRLERQQQTAASPQGNP